MAINHKIKSISKKLILYILLTIVPSLLISYYFADHQVKDNVIANKSKAQKYANQHAINIENFLGETVGRLEMLASSVKIQNSNLTSIETILKETQAKDSRFSGFYLAGPSGDLLISTNPTTSVINVGDRPYFQHAINTGQTSISEAHIGRVTGRYIITIATPIVEHGVTQSVLLASLRLDEIEKSIKGFIHNELIIVSDPNEQIVIKAGQLADINHSVKSSIPISQVPWTISAFVIPERDFTFGNVFLEYLMLLLTITNITYLLFKYILLRKKVEHDQKQTEIQKLELIGNLAASTAHEIRNPLTGIKGLVTLLSEEHQDKKSQYYFGVIGQEIDRINGIVSELLVLGKPTSYTLSTYDAKTIMKEIEPIIQSEANLMNVELIIRYANVELPISCVKDHLKQVILNLSKNSLQAMPNGGGILTILLEKHAQTCVIRVEDTGIGMPKEQLLKAFSPFFTMKKEGSGLGLTVCKRIIESFGGQIVIDSKPHIGTQVEITLPLKDE
ncbi:ATP-binding protein [Neobacillus sp. DY30]|uniref:ATP-binding protein n=1 Tax=Neobacillus sp. DY30 TaxID=3047871 RepID=UPI0024BFF69C|nr:ATP-binding protein [Neobacillus sp. DY30]WHY01457.1 ATP-binding protein [Neobacillus sp. DY30]